MERIQFEGGPWHGRVEHREIDPTAIGRLALHTERNGSGYYRISESMPPGPDADWLAWWVPARSYAV